MDAASGRSAPARGLVVIGCAVLSAAALSWLGVPFHRWGYESGATIYPWWTWVLIAGSVGAGSGVVLAASERGRSMAAGVGLVTAAQLAGTGLVAAKHWKPAQGMGGYPGPTDTYERLALVVAAAGLVAAATALWQLLADRAVGRRPAALAPLVVDIGIVVLLPVLMLDPADASRLTSWGAVGLVYAGPWGGSVAVSAWLPRPAALTVQAAVSGCALLAAVGPQMTDLLLADDARFGVVAVVVAMLAALVAVSRPSRARLP